MTEKRTYTLDQLCAAAQVSKRTVRYYIQQGLLERPEGEKRGSYYLDSHLEQLVRISNLKNDGLSLDRIRELMSGQGDTPAQRQVGAIEMWTRIHLGTGIELNIEASTAGLTPEQLRALTNAVVPLIERIKENGE